MSFLTMIKSIYDRLNTLRTRLLLIFLFVVVVILLATLYIVRSATFEHSTGQVLSHSQTSASVTRDKIHTQSALLENNLADMAKNFSVKQVIVGAKGDKASLISVMQNFQRRISADFFVVLDDQQELLAASELFDRDQSTDLFESSGMSWKMILGEFYLVNKTPVKFVQTSRKVNAWILMGVKASSIFNQELFDLTGLQISLILPGKNNQIIGSTFNPDEQTQLETTSIVLDSELHHLIIDETNYIYGIEALGDKNPYYILLATAENEAYLSYNDLIIQLIILLIVASLLAIAAAMLLSNTITNPIRVLVKAAHKISQGTYASEFPSCSTVEVNSLSDAIKDMQQGIKEREEQINQLAYFDKLTNLPNRNRFSEKLSQAIDVSTEQKVMVAMMDVDRFKDINDTVGHDIGDKLLQQIADRLRTYSVGEDFYARIGGDEFGLIFSETNGHSPEIIASDIAQLFEQPFNLDGLVLDIEVSIGVAIYPHDAEDAQGLMQCSDIALYSCKGHHHSYAIYAPELNKHSVQRLNLMSELKEALAAGQLELYYQPKLSIQNNKFESVECLIRWIHPVHGFIPPDDFIGLAEQTGAIRFVTHWGLRTALMQQRKWRDQGHSFNMAVNISALDLVDMKLPAYVSELLSEFDTEPHMLTLEVTESAIMCDPESAIKALNTLRRMGIVLSIDDFGTGFSSMAQLKKMPVDELKIDKAFVLDLASNQDDQVMVKTLVSLAENLGLRTVAEGVEDQDALKYLTAIGCTKAQGYYLSRPLPIGQFDEWHAEHLKSTEQEKIA